jgi:glycosyltransferase involved in cell wall biosynthesis
MGIPKVSVLIMAYNHEPYLGEALDSVLTQATDFEVEIVVGEDGSTDGTRGVLENYAARYNNITPLYRDGTDKLYVNGKATSRKNLVDLLQNRVHGEYVAWLDGDDYWTDPLKLQKQVSTLDQNPEIAICAHRVIVLDTDQSAHIG